MTGPQDIGQFSRQCRSGPPWRQQDALAEVLRPQKPIGPTMSWTMKQIMPEPSRYSTIVMLGHAWLFGQRSIFLLQPRDNCNLTDTGSPALKAAFHPRAGVLGSGPGADSRRLARRSVRVGAWRCSGSFLNAFSAWRASWLGQNGVPAALGRNGMLFGGRAMADSGTRPVVTEIIYGERAFPDHLPVRRRSCLLLLPRHRPGPAIFSRPTAL